MYIGLIALLFCTVAVTSSSIAPHSCAPFSPLLVLAPSACNYSLPFSERASAILSLFNTSQRVRYFGALTQSHDFIPYDASTNIKSFLWVTTCIHGLASNPSPQHNNTVFPHASSLGATFDTALVTLISLATATEARIISSLNYDATNGTQLQSLSCAGGPLANTIHDSRWGRVAEAYGEDPHHAAAIGVAAMTALQNRSSLTSAGETFVAMSTTIRHWLGFHRAQGDNSSGLPNGGIETISRRWLFDQQTPVYRALAVDAQAEGVMCSMNSLNGVPACANLELYSILRDSWNSSAIVQTDCCDSLSTAVDELKYYPTLEDAVVASMEAGLQGLFTTDPTAGVAALATAVANGRVSSALLDAAITRQLVARFRVGEFDTENPENPFRVTPPISLLDGAAHRALNRRSVAAGIVLLENVENALPLPTLANKRIAVIGPFANCTGLSAHDDKPDGSLCSYSHSYAGLISNPSTVLSAALLEVAAAGSGASVTYARGSGITETLPGGIAAAVTAAAAADVTVLVLGTGQLVEREGLNRLNFSLPAPQMELLTAVSAAAGAANLVVILVNGGGLDLGPAPTTLAHSIIFLGYAGGEAGNGLFDVLLGRTSPAGRLPSTWYRNSYLTRVPPLANFDMVVNGTGRTYRFVDENDVAYRFGHGLSYSRFLYSALSTTLLANCSVAVSVTVANVGSCDADEVVQVYVRVPRISLVTPAFALVAFKRVALVSGAPLTLFFLLSQDTLASTLDDGNRSVAAGSFLIFVAGNLPTDPVSNGNVVNASFDVAQGKCGNVSADMTQSVVAGVGSETTAIAVANGTFDAATGPSSIVWFGATQSLLIFESIFCGYWGHAGISNSTFAGHSYFRIRDATTGRILVNVSESIGFAYGSAFVDHDANGGHGRFWIFATPHDRCHHPVINNDTGVYGFYSDDADLKIWTRARTDVEWNLDGKGYNTAVARVNGPSPLGLPPHTHIMVTDHCKLFINNAGPDGDLRTGWFAAIDANVSAIPDACQCPSIKYVPADKMYYIITGGHAIWLVRSSNLANWFFPSAGRRPVIKPSVMDGNISEFSGGLNNLVASDNFYRSQGKNTTSEMLANLADWDFNSNDADMCCESWAGGGAEAVTHAYFNFGASSQTVHPTHNLSGPSAMQVISFVNSTTLDVVLRSYFT